MRSGSVADEVYRFMKQGEGHQTMLAPANEHALRFVQGLEKFCLMEPRELDPAKAEAHGFLFKLLRQMHANWPGEQMSFEWWRALLKQHLIPGACETRPTKSGEVVLRESWSPYSLSKKRQMEIIDAVKQVCRDVMKWTDEDIERAVKG